MSNYDVIKNIDNAKQVKENTINHLSNEDLKLLKRLFEEIVEKSYEGKFQLVIENTDIDNIKRIVESKGYEVEKTLKGGNSYIIRWD